MNALFGVVHCVIMINIKKIPLMCIIVAVAVIICNVNTAYWNEATIRSYM